MNDAEHDHVYQQGRNLISPYMQIHGKKSKPANGESARVDIGRGIELLQRALALKPTNWPAYWIIGKGYQALAEHENACGSFRKSFELEKNNADVAREFMFECLMLGRASDGIEAALHACRVKPNDAGLLANLALALLIGNRNEEALQNAEQSLALAPDDTITNSLRQCILDVREGKRPQPQSLRELHA